MCVRGDSTLQCPQIGSFETGGSFSITGRHRECFGRGDRRRGFRRLYPSSVYGHAVESPLRARDVAMIVRAVTSLNQDTVIRLFCGRGVADPLNVSYITAATSSLNRSTVLRYCR